jgi:hypothetical protein
MTGQSQPRQPGHNVRAAPQRQPDPGDVERTGDEQEVEPEVAGVRQLGHRVKSAVQLTSQVWPLSGENDCCQRAASPPQRVQR